jgi:hypothetical protein
MLVVALWSVSRNVQRSRYRRALWQQQDTLIVIASIIVILVMLATWLTHRAALVFYPYPRLDWPAFSPFIGVTLLLIAAPALVNRLTQERSYD